MPPTTLKESDLNLLLQSMGCNRASMLAWICQLDEQSQIKLYKQFALYIVISVPPTSMDKAEFHKKNRYHFFRLWVIEMKRTKSRLEQSEA